MSILFSHSLLINQGTFINNRAIKCMCEVGMYATHVLHAYWRTHSNAQIRNIYLYKTLLHPHPRMMPYRNFVTRLSHMSASLLVIAICSLLILGMLYSRANLAHVSLPSPSWLCDACLARSQSRRNGFVPLSGCRCQPLPATARPAQFRLESAVSHTASCRLQTACLD